MLTKDQLYNRYDALCDICSDLRGEDEDDDMMQLTISMLERAICYFEKRLKNKGTQEYIHGKGMLMKVKIEDGAYLPERAHSADAGLDLKSPVDAVLAEWDKCEVRTGVHVELPKGTVGMVKTRSSMNAQGIQCEGVIDEGYTGEIVVILQNHTNRIHTIKAGDKIAQLVILPVIRPEIDLVDELEETERGDKGFGSSGK